MRFTTFFMIIFIVTVTMWAPQSAAKGEIYRWVDENGVVHFGDRAPKQNDAEKISLRRNHGISAQPSADPAPVNPSAVDPVEAQDPQPSYAQQLRDERAEARQKNEAEAKVAAENCQRARNVLRQLEPSPRVIVTHKDGSVTRMDDDVRMDTLENARGIIAEYCGK